MTPRLAGRNEQGRGRLAGGSELEQGRVRLAGGIWGGVEKKRRGKKREEIKKENEKGKEENNKKEKEEKRIVFVKVRWLNKISGS